MQDPRISENVSGNFIRLDDEGGVTTVFGDVQESYHLTDEQADDLYALLDRYDPRELLTHIPAPILLDLSVAMSNGDLTKSEFKDIRYEFEDDRLNLTGFKMQVQGNLGSNDEEQEPGAERLGAQLIGLREQVNELRDRIPDAAVPDEVGPSTLLKM